METPSLNTTHTDFWAKLPRKKLMYRDSIKYFPLYKHLLQENYVEYKHIFFLPLLKLVSKNTSWVELHFERKKKYVCIPRIFLIINVCNQEKTLCSPCIFQEHGTFNLKHGRKINISKWYCKIQFLQSYRNCSLITYINHHVQNNSTCLVFQHHLTWGRVILVHDLLCLTTHLLSWKYNSTNVSTWQ